MGAEEFPAEEGVRVESWLGGQERTLRNSRLFNKPKEKLITIKHLSTL